MVTCSYYCLNHKAKNFIKVLIYFIYLCNLFHHFVGVRWSYQYKSETDDWRKNLLGLSTISTVNVFRSDNRQIRVFFKISFPQFQSLLQSTPIISSIQPSVHWIRLNKSMSTCFEFVVIFTHNICFGLPCLSNNI